MIAGADWFEGCWIVVLEASEGGLSLRRVPQFADLLTLDALETLVIDTPIGLVEQGARSCDPVARRFVRPRHNSVFTAPIRPLLSAASYEEACRVRREIEGKGCSKQAYAIYPIIASVDQHISPHIQTRVREGHPELSFAHMNGGRGLSHYKGAPEGQAARIALLEPHFPEVGRLAASMRPRSAAVDLLDAFAMLWTARRVRSGEAVSIPDPPEYDSRGLRMEMVA